MADAHANFALTTVATAPVSPTAGTSLVVAAGTGVKFPAAPFNATIWPAGSTPSTTNAEIVRVTAVSTDTLTITRAQESTSARTVVAGDQIVAGITAKTLTDVESLVPTAYLAVSGASYETNSRVGQSSGSPPTSGTLVLAAIALPAGLTIGHIASCSTAQGAATPTNWWFGLYDNNRVQLATTADQTTTAWAAQTLKSLAIANIASGASSTFTTTYTGLHYVGIMVKATTTPGLYAAGLTSNGVGPLAPVLGGTSDTAQTTPPSFPHTANAITAGTNLYYAYVGV